MSQHLLKCRAASLRICESAQMPRLAWDLQTQKMDVDEDSDLNLDLDKAAWVFEGDFCAYGKITKSFAGSYIFNY